MELHNLKYTKGARGHKTKTYGRGFGSGIGKTSGKGTKGQKSRKSGHVRLGFEGGQTPIYRKIPKVGFNSFNFQKNYNVLTLREVIALKLDTVDYASLVKSRVIMDNKHPIKIIGNDKLTKAIKVTVGAISAGAKKAIEDAKGTVTMAAPKVIKTLKKVKGAKKAKK
ncbi:50S ribosomal protein L15 [Bacilli bacterium]|nr:50S ribosomal protein L15 [Bacilli bacterium]GHU35336.1 50S ribosomal protein L15 [Bacilli bacterium]